MHLAVDQNAEPEALYLSDEGIRRRLGLSENKWRAVKCALERDGLPAPDPLIGKRYWPAVKAFFDRRNGVRMIETAEIRRPAARMNLDAL